LLDSLLQEVNVLSTISLTVVKQGVNVL